MGGWIDWLSFVLLIFQAGTLGWCIQRYRLHRGTPNNLMDTMYEFCTILAVSNFIGNVIALVGKAPHGV